MCKIYIKSDPKDLHTLCYSLKNIGNMTNALSENMNNYRQKYGNFKYNGSNMVDTDATKGRKIK